MKWSNFIYKTDSGKNKILFNTINSGVIEIGTREFELINNCLSNEENLPTDITEYTNQLKEMDFLIDNAIDEKSIYLNALIEDWNNDQFFCVHILPTTNCNFNCKYCYQSGISRKHSLDNNDGIQIIKYLEKYLSNRNIKHSNVVIHGGEPTLNWKIVELLLPRIENLYNQLGITFHTQIVTNGFLLTSEKADFLAKYNWNRAQITLDGLPETHNQRRNLKSSVNTFGQIVTNMKYILDNDRLSRIDLRINYDKNNINEIPQLLHYIIDNFDKDKIKLSFGLVTSTIKDTEAAKYAEQDAILPDNAPIHYFKLYKLASDLGFSMQEFFTFDGYCTSKMKNSMVISADGNIYKCLSMVGRDEFSVGQIYDEPLELKNYFYTDLYEECFNKKCEFIPMCHTGCRFDAYLKNGNVKSFDRRRDQMKEINSQILNYLYT